MKIHLLPDEDMDPRRVKKILSLLEETGGVINFKLQKPVPVKTLSEKAHFEEFFQVCARARAALRLPSNEYLVLLTDRPNHWNYFASLDHSEPRNSFVHAGEWKLFLDCEDVLPVAFTVLNIVLLHKTEPDPALREQIYHRNSIGCVHDFCQKKTDVIFKLRTGDICDVCIERMRGKGLSDIYLEHAIRILGHLSRQMRHHFSFQPTLQLSRMEIDMKAGTITLPDYDDRKVHMEPLSLAYYVLLLLHPDGIMNAEWQQVPMIRVVWQTAYRVVAPLENERVLNATIAGHCANDQYRNSRTREVKEAFEKSLGPRIAADYIVKVIRGKGRLVTLPRNNVTIRNFNSLDKEIKKNKALEEAWRTMKADA